MKTDFLSILLGTFLLTACNIPTPNPQSETGLTQSPPVQIPITEEIVSPAPLPIGNILIVENTNDEGEGSLREALNQARGYDRITFNEQIFPPNQRMIIKVQSELPHINKRNIILDASNADVILDGSAIERDWVAGLQIVNTQSVTIMGVHITGFSGPGIAISGDSRNNLIGGDRSLGEGNLLTRNAIGIDVATPQTTKNTITGNLIGMEPVNGQDYGNRRAGISISEGAYGNTVGPDNVIAYNQGPGVMIYYSETQQNTITGNSMHHNNGLSIHLMRGGNNVLPVPVITDFDLAAGTVSGITCPLCKVEIFSDSSDASEIYEGWETAQGNGEFLFQKDSPLIGPRLTATNTDGDGNTSQLSLPTYGSAGTLFLQTGNDFRRIQFQHKPSRELEDNRIASQFDSFGLGETYDLGIYNLGVTRARVAITGLEPELVNWDLDEFDFTSFDFVIDRLVQNGLTITYVLVFWDRNTYESQEDMPCYRFTSPAEVDNYIDFVDAVVDHYKDRVEYFEIWNEPDIPDYCPKSITSADYIRLVRRTVRHIQENHPDVKFTVGAVSNTVFSNANTYLFDVLQSDIMPLVDVVSWHPMYGTSPEYPLYEGYYYNYPQFVQDIKDTAFAHGFTGEFQADEIGWATPYNAVDDQPWVYTATTADKYAGRGIVMHLGMDVGVGLGEGNSLVRNLCTAMDGANPVDLPLYIQSQADNIVHYTFSLPEGGTVVALWTDGIAVEFAPGVEAALAIPNFSAGTATGIDVLYGMEQPLNIEMQNGALIIQDLLVKDYPTLIRFTPTP